jgi:hypothetical protein
MRALERAWNRGVHFCRYSLCSYVGTESKNRCESLSTFAAACSVGTWGLSRSEGDLDGQGMRVCPGRRPTLPGEAVHSPTCRQRPIHKRPSAMHPPHSKGDERMKENRTTGADERQIERVRPDLANRPDPDWQAAAATISHGGAESRLNSRARLSTHPVRSQLTVVRSRSCASRRTPARAPRTRRLRHRLRAGYATLARSLGRTDRTWRVRNRLGAGDTTAPRLRAGSSGSAPYRRARLAAIVGGGIVGAARRSPTAAVSWRLEAA